MGTNYYWERGDGGTVCPTCGRGSDGEKLHIGKSSAGWVFSLHVIPTAGLNTFEDWKKLFTEGRGQIRDEYGDAVSVPEMLSIITERHHPDGLLTGTHDGRGRYIKPGERSYRLCEWEFC